MKNIRHVEAKAKYYSLIAEGKKAEWCIGEGNDWRESEPLWNLENSVYLIREKPKTETRNASRGLGIILNGKTRCRLYMVDEKHFKLFEEGSYNRYCDSPIPFDSVLLEGYVLPKREGDIAINTITGFFD